MKPYTVIVDDDCGTARIYVCEAETPNSAAAYAERIYNAHSSIGGKVKMVFPGAPQEGCFWDGINLNDPANVIDLRRVATDHVI